MMIFEGAARASVSSAAALGAALVISACGSPTAEGPAPTSSSTAAGTATPSPSSSASSTPPSSESTGPATPVPVGQDVFTVHDGPSYLAVSGDKFAVLAGYNNSPLALTVFDLSGRQLARTSSSDVSESCKLAMTTRSDGVDVLLTERDVVTPAQGINPAATGRTLIASDAGTLSPLWTLPLQPPLAGSDSDHCSSGGTTDNDLTSRVSFTSDGKYALVKLFTGGTPLAVDLKSGVSRPAPDVRQVVGPYLLTVHGGDAFPTSANIVDPATGSMLGTTGDKALLANLRHMTASNTQPQLLLSGSEPGGNSASGTTQALTLPALAPVWQVKTPASGPFTMLQDEQAQTLLLSSDSAVTALSEKTGAMMWTVPVDRVCDVSGGKVLVNANTQLAVLDASTGKQLTFDASRSTCPLMLGHGYSYSELPDGITVTRVL